MKRTKKLVAMVALLLVAVVFSSTALAASTCSSTSGQKCNTLQSLLQQYSGSGCSSSTLNQLLSSLNQGTALASATCPDGDCQNAGCTNCALNCLNANVCDITGNCPLSKLLASNCANGSCLTAKNASASCVNGNCATSKAAGCLGGNCATSKVASSSCVGGNCATSKAASSKCASGNCTTQSNLSRVLAALKR